MEISFDLDFGRFLKAIEESPEAVMDGAKRGMHDVLDDWQAEAIDIAPLDKGTLRRSITQQPLDVSNGEIIGEITANAIEVSKKGRFNYAYYIHEMDAGGKDLRHPGTEKKFLEVPAKRNEKKYAGLVEDQIAEELKRKGLA